MTALNDLNALQASIAEAVLGQDEVIRQIIVGLLANGHLLLESLPGLAKTRTVKALARHLDAQMSRIQFTPDLLPSDITGAEVLHQVDGQNLIRFQPGPLFGNLILADEINRAPAKVQAALLEAMEERQITVAGNSHPLPELFIVLATQNPIEQEGTYPLPEAQLDRFMFNLTLGYPTYEAELSIVRNTTSGQRARARHVLSAAEIQAFQALVRRVPVADNVIEYAVGLVHKTRPGTERAAPGATQYLEWGAGPRASQHLVVGAKCNALLNGKYSPDIEDVRAVALPILRHRIVRNFKAEAEGITTEKIIQQML